jgi:acyl carrier protein
MTLKSGVTLDELRALIQRSTNKQLAKLSNEARLDELGLESIDRIRLIVALEREYSIEIDEETAKRLETVQDLLEHVAGGG